MSTLLIATLLQRVAAAQEEPAVTDQGYEREELGVNKYTAPSIEQVFKQLDDLKPLPFDQLWRKLPENNPPGREQKGLIFGSVIADGFLIVEAERKNLVNDLGRVLIKEARGLGVADRVMRHSASLTELGRKGRWSEIRSELIATQADVEQAMVELRDQKMAHLISLGGWLRGLEISSEAVEANFSPARARVLFQTDLTNYFREELTTLPPQIAHTELFDKIRAGVKVIASILEHSAETGLQPADVQAIHDQARALNMAIRSGG